MIKDFEEDFDEKYERLAAGLEKARELIFTKENLMLSYTAEKLPKELLEKEVESLKNACYAPQEAESELVLAPRVRNEGFKTSSKVQYVAKGGDFRQKGYEYNGMLKVLQVMFSYDYLWQNVRVQGGAYGCMFGCSRYGGIYLTSYRDPNLKATLETYQKAWEYVRDFNADERDMTKFIIGAIGNQDIPQEPSSKGIKMFRAWLMGVTTELVQKERDEMLGTTVEKIRSLAPMIRDSFADEDLCVIGNENRLEEDKDLFGELRSIF
jgi:hypothetical protein